MFKCSNLLTGQLTECNACSSPLPGIMMTSIQKCTIVCLFALTVTCLVSIQRYGFPHVSWKAPLPAKSRRKGEKGQVDRIRGVNEQCDNATNETRVWELEQEQRKRLLWDMCRTLQSTGETYTPPLVYRSEDGTVDRGNIFRRLLVIDSLKLIYCFIPKVGCTSWKRLFLVVSGEQDSMSDIGQREAHVLTMRRLRTLASYPSEEAKRLLATYRKFLFVRNPFERVLSAYQDKFQNDYPSSKVFRRAWSERIIRASGPSSTTFARLLKTQRRGDGTINVTFAQFARFLSSIKGRGAPQFMNEHWTQMYGLCHPCLIDYDYIGHYDTLVTDAQSILTAVGADPSIRFPNFTTNPTGSSDGRTLLRYYSTLSISDIEALYAHFAVDFSLFGYDLPESVRTLLDSRGRINNHNKKSGVGQNLDRSESHTL